MASVNGRSVMTVALSKSSFAGWAIADDEPRTTSAVIVAMTTSTLRPPCRVIGFILARASYICVLGLSRVQSSHEVIEATSGRAPDSLPHSEQRKRHERASSTPMRYRCQEPTLLSFRAV